MKREVYYNNRSGSESYREMEDLHHYSIDSMTNVSSLVPMTKATLSGRDHLNQLTHSFVQAASHSNYSRDDAVRFQDGDSFGQESADSIKHNTKAIAQADYFLAQRQKYHITQQSKSKNSVVSDYSASPSPMREGTLKHQLLTGNKSEHFSYESRDQVVIRAEHEIPRQPLRNNNVFASRFEPAKAGITNQSEQTSSPIDKFRNNLRQDEKKEPEIKAKLINVEVVFENPSKRDTLALTLMRNSEERPQYTGVPQTKRTSNNQKQPRTVSTIVGSNKQQNFTANQRSHINVKIQRRRSGSQRRSKARETNTQMGESTPPQLSERSSAHGDKSFLSDNSNVILTEKYEKVEALNGVACIKQDEQPQKKIITVEMGKHKKNHMLKSDPLKNQQVRHSYYQHERGGYMPMIKYIYDSNGIMVDTHRKVHQPTVQKYINKANEDLRKQIKNQREYLKEVMGDRLQGDYQTAELEPIRSKSPFSQSTKHDLLSQQNPPFGSPTITPTRPKFMATQSNAMNNESLIDRHKLSSNGSSTDGQVLRATNEMHASNSKVMQDLLKKMRCQKMTLQNQNTDNQSPTRRLRINNDQLDQKEQQSLRPAVQHHPRVKKNRPSESSPSRQQEDQSAHQSLFLVGETFNSSHFDAQETVKRNVRNSQVPQAVRPRDHSLESEVLYGKMMRQASGMDELDSNIDKEILTKMKEFELAGQQLFGIGLKNQLLMLSPSSLLHRQSSTHRSNFFMASEQKVTLPSDDSGTIKLDSCGTNEHRRSLKKEHSIGSAHNSSSMSKSLHPTQQNQQVQQKQRLSWLSKKSPSPFVSNGNKQQQAQNKHDITKPQSYASIMIVKGFQPSGLQNEKKQKLGERMCPKTLPISPRSDDSKLRASKTQNNNYYEGYRLKAQNADLKLSEQDLQQVEVKPADLSVSQMQPAETQVEEDNVGAEALKENTIFSTKTLLSGDHSTAAIALRKVNKPSEIKTASVAFIDDDIEKGDVIVSPIFVSARLIHESTATGKEEETNLNMAEQEKQSQVSMNGTEGDMKAEYQDSETFSPQNNKRVRFMYTRMDDRVYECRINLSKVLSEFQSQLLTVEEFQQRCLTLVVNKLVQRHHIDVSNEVSKLQMIDLQGKPIVSFLDWLQKPALAHDAHLIILVMDNSANIAETLQFFEQNRPASDGGVEFAPIDEELAQPVEPESPKRTVLMVQGIKSKLQFKGSAAQIKVVTKVCQFDAAKTLAEDSLFEESYYQQQSLGGDIFKVEGQQEKQKIKKRSDNSIVQMEQKETSYVNVIEDSIPSQNLLTSRFHTQMQEDQCEGHKVRTEGGLRKFNRMAQQHKQELQTLESDFSSYVCHELLSQIDKPIKTVSFGEKMSNPASKKVTKAKILSQKRKIIGSDTTTETPQIEQGMVTTFLENYYKRPIAMNAIRSSISCEPNMPMKELDNIERLSTSTKPLKDYSLLSSSRHRILPDVMRVQTGVPQSLRNQQMKHINQTLHTGSRNVDIRMSNMTQPMNLRGSVDGIMGHTLQGFNFNSGKGKQDKSSDIQPSLLLSATWNGARNSMMTTVPVRNSNTFYGSLGSQNLTSDDVCELESAKASAQTSRVNPMHTRFSLPAKSRKSSHHAESSFVPARAIKVPHQHKYISIKHDQDFCNMKNIFLANCLKLKKDDKNQGQDLPQQRRATAGQLTDRLVESMSRKIQASRGVHGSSSIKSGVGVLAPLGRRQRLKN